MCMYVYIYKYIDTWFRAEEPLRMAFAQPSVNPVDTRSPAA